MQRKKILLFTVIIAAIVISAMSVLAFQVFADDLSCGALSGCASGAKCTGPGRPNGCMISCDSGPRINCGYAAQQ